ncbi:MarR family winged helix-turn-helix transcriptional regulator [Candidatus Thalassolituus haligoni]|uniref:MarR family winged helix-turn-helix transcriptional regulator n=1 Tax=Candidatus Thalassolituus haligoni TaxID=3100113 RepID=UPI003516854A
MPSKTSPAASLDLDRYVPALITFLANKMSAGASRLYRDNFGVGIVEWRLLALLKVEDAITPNRMCQVIGLDKAAVSRSLKYLQASAYVHFRSDPEDARKTIVSLTESGNVLHDEIFQVAIKREALLLGDFSAAERDTLIDLLSRMNARVGLVNAYDPNSPANTQENSQANSPSTDC